MFLPLVYCRPGFETETELELLATAQNSGVSSKPVVRFNPGAVLLPNNVANRETVLNGFDFKRLCFARQLCFAFAILNKLPQRDKLAPVLAAVRTELQENPSIQKLLSVEVEVIPENQTAGIVNFSKSIYRPFVRSLSELGISICGDSNLRLHLFFPNYDTAVIALSYQNNSSPWQLGIPRLKFPNAAPSRSTLKLEEALLLLLSAEERQSLLKPGMRAVDLGASPGGWTFQFVSRGMHVTAVDNGKMDDQLMNTGLVSHLPADAFRFRPERPVDWMICDVVEQPARIADLVARWLHEGLCRRTIFNLKLPMKRRYEEVSHCETIIRAALPDAVIRKKQLFHDREEITCFIERD